MVIYKVSESDEIVTLADIGVTLCDADVTLTDIRVGLFFAFFGWVCPCHHEVGDVVPSGVRLWRSLEMCGGEEAVFLQGGDGGSYLPFGEEGEFVGEFSVGGVVPVPPVSEVAFCLLVFLERVCYGLVNDGCVHSEFHRYAFAAGEHFPQGDIIFLPHFSCVYVLVGG